MTLSIQAYAIHPLPTAAPFNDANQTICYDTNSLNNVKFNGQTGQGNALKNEIKKGMDHVSQNTDINIIEQCPGASLLSARHSNPNVKGETIPSSSTQKFIYYNTNHSVDYRTDNLCIPPAFDGVNIVNPKYIAIHEFGHFAGLGHPLPWLELLIPDSHTAMKSYCNQGYASLSPDDKNQINAFY